MHKAYKGAVDSYAFMKKKTIWLRNKEDLSDWVIKVKGDPDEYPIYKSPNSDDIYITDYRPLDKRMESLKKWADKRINKYRQEKLGKEY